MVKTYLSHDTVALYLVPRTRNQAESYRIRQWTSISAENIEQPFGPLTLTFPPDIPWVAASALDIFDGWEGYGFDLYVNSMTTPIWSGPIIRRIFTDSGTQESALCTLQAETFCQHFLERRANETSANDYSPASYALEYGGNIILQAIRAALVTPLTPAGWTAAAEVRTDVGAGWTVAAAADGIIGTQQDLNTQQGNNLRTFVEEVAKKDDIYVSCPETPAGTWTYAVARYVGTDRSGTICLSPRTGTLRTFEAVSSVAPEDICNKARVRGTGKDDAQSYIWATDLADITTRGVYEGEVTIQGEAPADTDVVVNDQLTAGPLETMRVTITDAQAAKFNVDYAMRDLVSWSNPIWGATGTARIRGWRLTQSGTGPFGLELVLGDTRGGWSSYAAQTTGMRGCRQSPGRLRNTEG